MSDGFVWGTVSAIGPLRVKLDGDTTALPFTPDSLIDPLQLSLNERVRCELYGNRIVIHGRTSGDARLAAFGALAGTSAQRDAYFGAPSSSAAMLALQGKQWFNTDKGWLERYYALYNAGTQPLGLSRLGNGWYPVEGMLPVYRAHKSANHTMGSSDTTIDYDTVDENIGGFVKSGANVTPPIPGRYHVMYRHAIATGSTIYTNTRLRVGSTTIANIQMGPHSTSFFGGVWQDAIALDASSALSVVNVASGSLIAPAVDSSANLLLLSMKYLGPA